MFKFILFKTIILGVCSTPFKGEHSEAHYLLRDDGSSAHKLEAQKAMHNKYDHMVNRSLNKNP